MTSGPRVTAKLRRKNESEELLRLIAPAMRDILWCALVWNDHNFGYDSLTKKADSAAKALGFNRTTLGSGVDEANALFARIDQALASTAAKRT